MNWSDIDSNPRGRTLRQFGALCLLFYSGLAYLTFASGLVWLASAMAVLAFLGALGCVRPSLLRPIYTAWMLLIFPGSWVINHLLLAIIYFGLFTPMALACRSLGRDPLRRRWLPNCDSYWTPKMPPKSTRRYFRPY